MGSPTPVADIRDVGRQGMFVDAGEIEIAGPKLAREIDRSSFGQSLDDGLERDRREGDAVVGGDGAQVQQFRGMETKSGRDAPVEPRADRNEVGSVSDSDTYRRPVAPACARARAARERGSVEPHCRGSGTDAPVGRLRRIADAGRRPARTCPRSI